MSSTFCSYYTDSPEMIVYMTNMLSLSGGERVLEPCAGEGVFLHALLSRNIPGLQLDALELNPEAVAVLEDTFGGLSEVHIRKSDTLLDETLDRMAESGGAYDCIIGNPPYGAWQDLQRRALMKEKYPECSGKETYALFLLRAVSLLKTGGRLCFLVPDTFLFLNRHTRLRRALLTRTRILEIVLFPSRFFPGINFGYSGLCIITLEKAAYREKAVTNKVRVIRGLSSVGDLARLAPIDASAGSVLRLRQSDILKAPRSAFLLEDERIASLAVAANSTLGDFADIVTGLYTGDNRRFLRVRSRSVKRSGNYEVLRPEDASAYIPFVKGSSLTGYARAQDDWFIRWDEEARQAYRTGAKARFQNASWFFQRGIAVPMVKSSPLNAAVMENRIFDQSIVGVFPKDEHYFYYILALLNSSPADRLLRMINPTANHSCSYIRGIPFAVPTSEELEKVTSLARQAEQAALRCDLGELDRLGRAVSACIADVYMRVFSVRL